MPNDTPQQPDALTADDGMVDALAQALFVADYGYEYDPLVDAGADHDWIYWRGRAESVLAAAELIEWRRKAEVYDRIAEIVAEDGDPEWLHPTDAASSYFSIARMFPQPEDDPGLTERDPSAPRIAVPPEGEPLRLRRQLWREAD